MSICNQNVLNAMRDCVRQCLERGPRSKQEFKDMRHGIICQLKQQGCGKEAIAKTMQGWVDKYPQKLTAQKFNQNIRRFIDWVFKNDVKVSCKYLKERNYCFSPCKFEERMRNKANADLSSEAIYTKDEIRKFLAQHVECKRPDECAAIYKAIDRKRVELGLTRDRTVFIGLREIREAVRNQGCTLTSPEEVKRLVNELQDSDLLQISEQGKSGEFKGKSNGYKLFTPDDVLQNELANANDEVTTDS